MPRPILFLLAAMMFTVSLSLGDGMAAQNPRDPRSAQSSARTYLGFDRNTYPGDAALPILRRTLSFSGYWLNVPPGETSNSWAGKRENLFSNGFGFLLLFNGRSDKEIKSATDASALGHRDGTAAVEAAEKEGFPNSAVIFLDQEEGGGLLPEQLAYVLAWIDAVNAAKYKAGIYCSGIPALQGSEPPVTTADFVHSNATGRKIFYWVYNDACPPSPGCAYPKHPPRPSQSGIAFAYVWQFAQSPRRRTMTAACPSNYSPEGQCFAPAVSGTEPVFVDLDSATSADPSHGRR